MFEVSDQRFLALNDGGAPRVVCGQVHNFPDLPEHHAHLGCRAGSLLGERCPSCVVVMGCGCPFRDAQRYREGHWARAGHEPVRSVMIKDLTW